MPADKQQPCSATRVQPNKSCEDKTDDACGTSQSKTREAVETHSVGGTIGVFQNMQKGYSQTCLTVLILYSSLIADG